MKLGYVYTKHIIVYRWCFALAIIWHIHQHCVCVCVCVTIIHTIMCFTCFFSYSLLDYETYLRYWEIRTCRDTHVSLDECSGCMRWSFPWLSVWTRQPHLRSGWCSGWCRLPHPAHWLTGPSPTSLSPAHEWVRTVWSRVYLRIVYTRRWHPYVSYLCRLQLNSASIGSGRRTLRVREGVVGVAGMAGGSVVARTSSRTSSTVSGNPNPS